LLYPDFPFEQFTTRGHSSLDSPRPRSLRSDWCQCIRHCDHCKEPLIFLREFYDHSYSTVYSSDFSNLTSISISRPQLAESLSFLHKVLYLTSVCYQCRGINFARTDVVQTNPCAPMDLNSCDGSQKVSVGRLPLLTSPRRFHNTSS
jgi:hypothetical protein